MRKSFEGECEERECFRIKDKRRGGGREIEKERVLGERVPIAQGFSVGRRERKRTHESRERFRKRFL